MNLEYAAALKGGLLVVLVLVVCYMAMLVYSPPNSAPLSSAFIPGPPMIDRWPLSEPEFVSPVLSGL